MISNIIENNTSWTPNFKKIFYQFTVFKPGKNNPITDLCWKLKTAPFYSCVTGLIFYANLHYNLCMLATLPDHHHHHHHRHHHHQWELLDSSVTPRRKMKSIDQTTTPNKSTTDRRRLTNEWVGKKKTKKIAAGSPAGRSLVGGWSEKGGLEEREKRAHSILVINT